jgi:iron(III) transport system ATP-binding protein
MARLRVENVSKLFGDVVAVDDISFDVADGEFLALLGPSGCGKTTVLRLIAGFERVTEGTISFDDDIVSSIKSHLPAEKRRVGIVFQSYALWPHMTVARNVGYPLQVAGISGEEYHRRIAETLELVGLHDLGHRRPAELSGGQRQRVALARCLIMEPALVLLDEPLANLDVHLRAAMEQEFAEFHKKTGSTTLYITHDQAEAMALADRIAVMDRGRIVQVSDPAGLYDCPANIMVADFIGEGAIIPAEVTGAEADGRCQVTLKGADIVMRCTPGEAPRTAHLCLRPENLAITGAGEADTIPCRVTRAVYRGGITAVEAVPIPGPGPASDTASNTVPATDSDLVPRAVLFLLVQGPAPKAGDTIAVTVTDGWVIPEEG